MQDSPSPIEINNVKIFPTELGKWTVLPKTVIFSNVSFFLVSKCLRNVFTTDLRTQGRMQFSTGFTMVCFFFELFHIDGMIGKISYFVDIWILGFRVVM